MIALQQSHNSGDFDQQNVAPVEQQKGTSAPRESRDPHEQLYFYRAFFFAYFPLRLNSISRSSSSLESIKSNFTLRTRCGSLAGPGDAPFAFSFHSRGFRILLQLQS